jgi:hypothetical protein
LGNFGYGVYAEADGGGIALVARALTSVALDVVGNGADIQAGDPHCGAGTHTAAIGFLASGLPGVLDCGNNFALGGRTDTKETVINRPTGGTISFRECNGPDQMRLMPGGGVGIGTNAPNAKLDVRGGGGNSGFGLATDSNAWQGRAAGGWVKAMAYIDPTPPSGSPIVRCYNSQASGAAVSTPPCGFTFTRISVGGYNIDFGFQVNDRFVMFTPVLTFDDSAAVVVNQCNTGQTLCPATANQLPVLTFYTNNSVKTDTQFLVFVY